MDVFKNGIDEGWLDDQNWWLNPDHPYAFLIQKTEDNYPNQYFKHDHVSPIVAKIFCQYVDEYYKKIMKKDLVSVVELGCGGGWFLKEFMEIGVTVNGYDGAFAAIAKCWENGISSHIVKYADLRKPIIPKQKYDIALCTEVAEHIEIPFSSVLVQNLVNHSDLVWFSTEEPDTNRPHVHHPNERPYKFWIKLFEFFNYGYYMLPSHVYDDCLGRGRMIFYNKKTISI